MSLGGSVTKVKRTLLGAQLALRAGFARSQVPLDPDDLRAGAVLLVFLDAIGDLVMATPAIRALRKQFHGQRLDLAVQQKAASVLEGEDLADRIEVVPRLSPTGRANPQVLREYRSVVRRLRAGGYRTVICLTTNEISARLAAQLNSPYRIGWRGSPVRFGLLQRTSLRPWLNYELQIDRGLRHHTDRWLDFARQIGADTRSAGEPRLTLSDSELQTADACLREEGIDDPSRLVVVGPFASTRTKRWPVERFAVILDRLADCGRPVLVVAGVEDEPEARQLLSECAGKPVLTVGDPSAIRLLAGILARARLFIGNDSGPGHVASAVGTRCLILFGPIDDQQVCPRGLRSSANVVLSKRLPCSPCNYRNSCPQGSNRCMEAIEVDEVWQAASSMLECGGEGAIVR